MKMGEEVYDHQEARKSLIAERRELYKELQERQVTYRQYEHMTQFLERQIQKVIGRMVQLAQMKGKTQEEDIDGESPCLVITSESRRE
jgi:hypothetical protein